VSEFVPTAGQAEALEVIRKMSERFPGGGGLAVISGYAGTGKTTLLKVLTQELPGLFVLTPTGKAAVRVKQAAGCDALTIHRWMYTPIKDEDTGEYRFAMKEAKQLQLPPNKTLIVDEASMVTSQVFEHLYFFVKTLGMNLVMIGDGFQLPPVERDPEKQGFSVFTIEADIKVNLTEVLRQALENPIIRISTEIRTNSNIMTSVLALPVVVSSQLDQALLDNWNRNGVIICHKNQTRHDLNNRIRELRGLPKNLLRENEPLLVTKNNYDLGVFNGEVFTVGELGRQHLKYPVVDRRKNKTLYMEFQEITFTDTDCSNAVVSPEEIFGKAAELDPDAIKRGSHQCMTRDYPELDKDSRPKHLHANLGYALTCHKSQGSEWPEALVFIEDSVRLSTQEGRRWLYTALTRARETVRVVWP
jgi:exodeoxyribonuclease-5